MAVTGRDWKSTCILLLDKTPAGGKKTLRGPQGLPSPLQEQEGGAIGPPPHFEAFKAFLGIIKAKYGTE